MEYTERLFKIHVGAKRIQSVWPEETLSWGDFLNRISRPVVDDLSREEYMKAPKATQDEHKDVGGYFAGGLTGGSRRAVVSRCWVTLDFDSIPNKDAGNELIWALNGLGCVYAAHPTRKHTPDKPRLRVVIPLDRDVSPDEYSPIARRLAEQLGMDFVDPASFKPGQMMYWPSVCKDSADYQVWQEDGEVYEHSTVVDGLTDFGPPSTYWLSANGVLGSYENWQDPLSWPRRESERKDLQAAYHTKPADPREKTGVVGAFVRAFGVVEAIERFIPETYAPVEGAFGLLDGGARWTYSGGSGVGGAVVFNNLWLYSFHATDPANTGHCINAWDLVRIHKFGELDKGMSRPTRPDRYPSHIQMQKLAIGLAEVRKELLAEELGAQNPELDMEAYAWMSELEVNPKTGRPTKVLPNILKIFDKSKELHGTMARNVRMDRVLVLSRLPWDAEEGVSYPREATEADESQIRAMLAAPPYYMDDLSRQKIQDALIVCSAMNAIDEPLEYFTRQVWDGVERLDTLFVRLFDAEDTPYTRAVTRKTFCAVVARNVETEPVKFDNCVVLVGAQGIGKSMFLKKILYPAWVVDSVPRDLAAKDAMDVIRGAALVELAEIDQFNKNETSTFKHFLSKDTDRYRPPYGHTAHDYKRRFVFIGTANETTFLRDSTGERRFWPVTCRLGYCEFRHEAFKWLEENRDQIWAEALYRWKQGESLTLDTPELQRAASVQQKERTITSELSGMVSMWLDEKVPEAWDSWTRQQRRDYVNSEVAPAPRVALREHVCVLEVWEECLGNEAKRIQRRDSLDVGNILRYLNWECVGMRKNAAYGSVQTFRRHQLAAKLET